MNEIVVEQHEHYVLARRPPGGPKGYSVAWIAPLDLYEGDRDKATKDAIEMAEWRL